MSFLRPMTEPEFAAWLETAIPEFAGSKVASGQWSEGESLELSRKEHQELLPHGRATPDNYFFTITDPQGTAVGVLWFAVRTKFNERIAHVFDVRVQPERQREGHASRAFLALENEVRSWACLESHCTSSGTTRGPRPCTPTLGFSPRTSTCSNLCVRARASKR